jgi:hypothetical protein
MAGFFARGTMKPPLGATINWSHPFAQGQVFSLLCNDAGNGGIVSSAVVPAVASLWGSGSPLPVVVSGTVTWASNSGGPAVQCGATTAHLSLSSAACVPLAGVTVLVIRRKLDTTNRDSSLFSARDSAGGGAPFASINAHVPYSDGTVYWDYGGTSGIYRLSVAGLSHAGLQAYVFTAGPQGSAIWQNGVKVASATTAISTTSLAAFAFYLNDSPAAGIDGDLIQLNFFQMNRGQWSDPLCQWWSAEPYAHLYPETAPIYDFLAAGGVTEIDSVGTAAGVATVAGVGAYSVPHPKSGFGAQKKARRHNR